MHLNSTVPPMYFPDPAQHSVLHLGLQPLDLQSWMQVDNDFGQFQQHKCYLKEVQAKRVYFALPESLPAQQEFHQLLLNHLSEDHSSRFQLQNQNIQYGDEYVWPSAFSSLWESSLLVQEDICLLEKSSDQYHLTAASVCSPSNWRLEEKIGRSLDFIHQPVPGYESQLSGRVNRLFGKLKADSPLLRYNWSVQANNELFWRDDLNEKTIDSEPCWYWRVERQTLRRLPETQAIVFTIRIYLHDLSLLKVRKNFEFQLREIIQRLPDDQVRYKGLQAFLSA